MCVVSLRQQRKKKDEGPFSPTRPVYIDGVYPRLEYSKHTLRVLNLGGLAISRCVLCQYAVQQTGQMLDSSCRNLK